MASIIELFDSRTGGTMGVSGARGVFTRHQVTTDNITDNPIGVLKDSTVTGSMPIGKPYPWGGFGVVCLNYSIVERKAPKIWEVDALFGPPFLLETPDAGLWNWEKSTGLTIEQALFSLGPTSGEFDVPIGPDTYILEDEFMGPSQPTDTFTADSRSGPVALIRVDGPNLIGLPRKRPIGILRLDRVFSYVSPKLLATIDVLEGTTNSTDFYGADRNTLLYIGSQVRNRSGGYLPGQPIEGRVTEVVLLFERDPLGFQPVELPITYTDSEGERPIRDSQGNPLIESHFLYRERDFQRQILGVFERGGGVGLP